MSVMKGAAAATVPDVAVNAGYDVGERLDPEVEMLLPFTDALPSGVR